MHERTRRAVARLLFVLLCAFPTGMTWSVVLMTFTPWYHTYRKTQFETVLAQRLGVIVEVDSVEYPAPATIRVHGLRLLQPETKAEVAKVRIATWVTTDQRAAIRLSQPELQSTQLRYVWRVIHERFLCQPELTETEVRIAADDVTIHSRKGSTTLQDFDAWLRPTEQGVEAGIQCLPADRHELNRVSIAVVRDRSDGSPETNWTMNTGGILLRCSALSDYFPVMAALGPNATFSGMLKWRISDDDWSIDLGGSRFQNVDLHQVTQGTQHRLTGNATVQFTTCRLQPGAELDLSGTLTAGPGYISQSLLRELHDELKLEVPTLSVTDVRDWPYDSLGLRFDLIGTDMTLEGICHKQRGQERLPAGILIANAGQSLCSGMGMRQTWVRLIRALWPDQAESVPVSRHTAWIFNLLPAPHPISLNTDMENSSNLPRITAASESNAPPSVLEP